MLTPSVSSPMGPGSDSEAIPIKFGKYNSNLIDSSQFGFEPLLLNGIDKVYCYLPSMRGEEPDKRHLNQFFHCEAEIRGSIDNLIPIIEGYIGFLSETLLTMPNILAKISLDPEKTLLILNEIAKSKSQIWETKNPPEIKNDAVRAERVGLTKIILDGQQRLTTLYLLINGEIPPYYKEKDIINDPRHLFFLDISILK
jgi:asparaginyl-tRNA synthetase